VAGAGTRDGALLLLGAGRIDQAALLASSLVYTLFGYFFLGAAGLPFLGAVMHRRVGGDSAGRAGSEEDPGA
jgi:hypothetical protein